MSYKPDVYSAVGVYRNNEWGLRPALYTSTFSIREAKGVVDSAIDPSWSFTVKKEEEKAKE